MVLSLIQSSKQIIIQIVKRKQTLVLLQVQHQKQKPSNKKQKIHNNMSTSLQIFKKYIKPDNQSLIPQIRYRTNFTNCINEAFENRGYDKVMDEDWDVIWSQKDGLNQIYQKRLLPHQKVNHFRNYFELCKKDNLIKNLKKHKKTLEKQGKTLEAKEYFCHFYHRYNFFPQTYILPSEYVLFADEFKRSQSLGSNTWIMKPTGKSQGKGIFLINKLNQLTQWQSNINSTAQPYIIQRYISNPLLIGGKKFDIRLYVLVTSYSPLVVYLYRNGFARFTHARYDQTKITDAQVHLTNVAIQKLSANYDQNIGGKWYLDKLKTYLLSKYGDSSVNECFCKIQALIIRTLEAMVKLMATDKPNSFELYGFDILLDNMLSPWLIQVNGSPSMTANTQKDKELKLALLDDTLTVLNLQKFLTGEQEQIGGFDLICKKSHNLLPQQKVTHNTLIIDKQKISFLGTQINRQDNYKKLAKLNSTRINQTIKTSEQPPLLAKKTNLLLTPTVPKVCQKRRVMSQNNQNLQPSSEINRKHTLGMSRKNIPQSGTKDFVIKQKNSSFSVNRQKTTNENDYGK